MPREIVLPPHLGYLEETVKKIMIDVNDEVLISHCYNKKPYHGVVTSYGIVWNSFSEFSKDAEVCHYFFQLYVTYPEKRRVVALGHADEIYNLHINPLTT